MVYNSLGYVSALRIRQLGLDLSRAGIYCVRYTFPSAGTPGCRLAMFARDIVNRA